VVAVKRLLYLCALACLEGVLVYAVRLASMPNLVGEAIEAVDNHDPAARDDVEAAQDQEPEAEDILRSRVCFCWVA
jgi:hypothetical protein